MDSEPDTLRVCLACGTMVSSCPWCTNGYQSSEQIQAWKKYRSKTQKLSDTHNLLSGLLKEIVIKLEAIGSKEALELANDGADILLKWEASEDKSSYSKDISEFQKSAIEIISKEY